MPTLRLLPELENSIRLVPGIRAASVVTGPDAVPTEVHVLAAPGKPPKQVVRDVQSLALAQYDIDIDHRIVSVVQIGADEIEIEVDGAGPESGDEPMAPRPVIASIMVRTGGNDAEAVVTLTTTGLVFEGRVVGPPGATHRPRLVAQATLKALEELLGRSVEVDAAQIVQSGSQHVALTVLTMIIPRQGEQLVSGSAVVRGDESDAVARSVLDALNRHLAG